MASMLMLGVVLKLIDQMSPGLRGQMRAVDGLRDKFKGVSDAAAGFGRASMANGMIGGGALMKSVSAFASLEDASTRLKVTMMDKDGLTGAFEQVNALAVKLGNELPGTSADFLNMMAALKAQGISDESILGGVGDATARMTVLLKKTPEEMAVFSAKLKTALGVADGDMLAFLDTIQRTYHMGVDATEMMYSFARSGGALKVLKAQGLEAGKALAPLYAIWVKGGLSGETVGTGFASIAGTLLDAKKIGKANAELAKLGMGPLKFTNKKGDFLGVEAMVKELDKLKSLDAVSLNAVLKEAFGGGQDQQMIATLVHEGVEGYRKMVADMEKQAALKDRIDKMLGTLRNLWDAASGTFTNTLAGFSEAMGDDLKNLVKWFGDLSEAMGRWIKENPVLAQWLGRLALGLSAVAIAGGALALGVAGITSFVSILMGLGPAVLLGVGAIAKLMTIMSAVGAFMLANPIIIGIWAIAIAAGLIIEHWEPIKGFFINLWDGIKQVFAQALEWIGAKMRALSDMMPDWMRDYTAPGLAANYLGEKLGPPRHGAAPAGNAGGKVDVNVRVDQDGRVKSVAGKSDSPRVPVKVDAGLMMDLP